MALATRCPHCQTAFRVASDQLKLRAGLVRCGTCKEIFNGIENLLHPDEDINAAVNAPTGAGAGRWPAPNVLKSPSAGTTLAGAASAAPAPAPAPTPSPASVHTPRDTRSRAEKSDNTLFQELIAEVDHPPPPAPREPERIAPSTPVKSGYAASYAPVQMAPLLRTPSSIVPGLGTVRPEPAPPSAQGVAAQDKEPEDAVAAAADPGEPWSALREILSDGGSATSAETAMHDAQVSASLWEAATSQADDDARVAPHRHDSLEFGVDGVPGSMTDRDIEGKAAEHDAARDSDLGHDRDQNETGVTPGQASMSPLPGLLRPSRLEDSPAASPAHDSAPEVMTAEAGAAGGDVGPADAASRRSSIKPLAEGDADADANPNPNPIADADADADDLPDFVSQDLRRQGLQRTVRPLLCLAAVLLALLLFGQLVYAFRTSLAANFPQTRPMLDDACRLIGCSVGLPMQIDSVSIESSDFQPQADKRDQFVLTVLLRNRGATVQAWPSIELTLNDATDKIVARRVIGPRDYLPAGTAPAKGFAAGSEQPIRLVFELARLTASGYRVYLFYP